MKKDKYIVRRYTDDPLLFREAMASTRKEARAIRAQWKREVPNSYCHTFKRAFEKRHPDFPLWFSIGTLLLVGVLLIANWCIYHIPPIAQLWK